MIRYDIVYKQAVTSEDMYLGMGNRTPATSSCEDMIVLCFLCQLRYVFGQLRIFFFQVKISLPGTKMADVVLDVKEKFLDCRSAKL